MAVMGVGRPQDSRQDRQDSTGQSGQAGQLAGQLKLSYPYPWRQSQFNKHHARTRIRRAWRTSRSCSFLRTTLRATAAIPFRLLGGSATRAGGRETAAAMECCLPQ